MSVNTICSSTTEPSKTEGAAPLDREKRSASVILLGGGANALSVARSLGRKGVKVYALNSPQAAVRYSRYATWIETDDVGKGDSDPWVDYLLGPKSDHLAGSLLIVGNDRAVEIVGDHFDALSEKYLLDDCHPQAQFCMLNKLATYQAAVEAGVTTPKFWVPKSLDELEAIRESLVFPLIVKPEQTDDFTQHFRGKYLLANDYDELVNAMRRVIEAKVDCMLVEFIPGGDDRLCSYYTYLDEDGNPLFDFTKRMIRRFPVNMGRGSYHITDWSPDLRDPSLKLLRHCGLRGLAMIEFKRDDRDGQLKLIEVNPRMSEANVLLQRCGLDLADLVYCRAVGLPYEKDQKYRTGVRLWYPLDDFMSFMQLRRRGQLSLLQWLRSLMHWKKLPRFAWSDPIPSLMPELHRIRRWLSRKRKS